MTNNRFVITGCSGGGKSTLIEALEARGHRVMPEPGRIIVREELAGGGAALPWVSAEKFARRAIEMGQRFHSDAAGVGGPVLFDRSILDATAAMERSGAARAGDFTTLLNQFPYAEEVFIAPPWPELFGLDDERQLGFADATAEYEHLASYYPKQGYRLTELPKVPIDERVAFVETHLERWSASA